MDDLSFRKEATVALAKEIRQVVLAHELSSVESLYALLTIVRSLGESIHMKGIDYSEKDVEHLVVLERFKTERDFGAAIILLTDQIHQIREMFLEKTNE